jgi:hypothetical protein
MRPRGKRRRMVQQTVMRKPCIDRHASDSVNHDGHPVFPHSGRISAAVVRRLGKLLHIRDCEPKSERLPPPSAFRTACIRRCAQVVPTSAATLMIFARADFDDQARDKALKRCPFAESGARQPEAQRPRGDQRAILCCFDAMHMAPGIICIASGPLHAQTVGQQGYFPIPHVRGL